MNKKLKTLTYIGRIEGGVLHVPRRRMQHDISQVMDEPMVEIIIRPEKRGKTQEQLGAFHGPIVEQIQADYMDRDGVYKSEDRIKQDLKEMFLPKVPQFYDDGSPVLIKIRHPERNGVYYDWHYEKVPSLADLSLEQMRDFIDRILEWYQHERGLTIIIDPTQRK
jgi:hypothetical protein